MKTEKLDIGWKQVFFYFLVFAFFVWYPLPIFYLLTDGFAMNKSFWHSFLKSKNRFPVHEDSALDIDSSRLGVTKMPKDASILFLKKSFKFLRKDHL